MTLEFNDILLYNDANDKVKIEVIYEDDTFWLSQKKMAELFDVGVPTINEHLQNIFKSGRGRIAHLYMNANMVAFCPMAIAYINKQTGEHNHDHL